MSEVNSASNSPIPGLSPAPSPPASPGHESLSDDAFLPDDESPYDKLRVKIGLEDSDVVHTLDSTQVLHDINNMNGFTPPESEKSKYIGIPGLDPGASTCAPVDFPTTDRFITQHPTRESVSRVFTQLEEASATPQPIGSLLESSHFTPDCSDGSNGSNGSNGSDCSDCSDGSDCVPCTLDVAIKSAAVKELQAEEIKRLTEEVESLQQELEQLRKPMYRRILDWLKPFVTWNEDDSDDDDFDSDTESETEEQQNTAAWIKAQ